MATGYNIRVGDAEREATASQLREHYADGRLTLDELNERLDQAFAAKTRADLNTVMRDLPMVPRPGMPGPAGSASAGSGSAAGSAGWRTADGRPAGAGPMGPGPMGSGPMGRPMVPTWNGSRSSGSSSRGFSFLAPVFALFWLCLVLGGVFLFGFGDKPVGIVLLLAALAFLRRLFGRRRRGRGRRCWR